MSLINGSTVGEWESGRAAEEWPKEGMESVYYKGNIVRVVRNRKE
jgi:hypothetical protein